MSSRRAPTKARTSPALHVVTPTIESLPLAAGWDRRVVLKLDCAQPAGSFKIRGIGHACQRYAADGAERFVSSSGGNAGLAVAYSGRRLGLPVDVVVPSTTSAAVRDLLRREGAEVIEFGSAWIDAHEYALQLAERCHGAYIHPFDDEWVWQGHATLIDEVWQEWRTVSTQATPSSIVVAVGGGGLLCGILLGLDRVDCRVPVIAVETHGADSLAQSVEAGERVRLPAITSIAKTLGASLVAEAAFEWSRTHDVRCVRVTDAQALAACRRFAVDHRMLVEPACGAALAAVYERVPEVLAIVGDILVVVCGGVGIDPALLPSIAPK